VGIRVSETDLEYLLEGLGVKVSQFCLIELIVIVASGWSPGAVAKLRDIAKLPFSVILLVRSFIIAVRVLALSLLLVVLMLRCETHHCASLRLCSLCRPQVSGPGSGSDVVDGVSGSVIVAAMQAVGVGQCEVERVVARLLELKTVDVYDYKELAAILESVNLHGCTSLRVLTYISVREGSSALSHCLCEPLS
jgi:hypothetical protein